MRVRYDRPPAKYCGKKVKYDKKGAVTAKNRRWDEDHIELRIYECDICGGWHLTHQLEWIR